MPQGSPRVLVRLPAGPRRSWNAPVAYLAFLGCTVLQGCAALTNPVRDGVPVQKLTREVVAKPKNGQTTIPVAYLRQDVPDVYRLDRGDVLGIFVEGILETRGSLPQPRVAEPGPGAATPSLPAPLPPLTDSCFTVRED